MRAKVDVQARILVVDDEPEIAESLADFLACQGYVVSVALTGQEAYHCLESAPRKEAIDLVLLDMRMPNLSGLDILAWLRDHQDEELRYTRVIMLTAATGNREKIDALEAGADDYITKPYHPQELLARVHTILRAQQLEKQLQQQRQQLAELNRVGNEITATLELRQVFADTAKGICVVLNVPMAAVFMRSPSRKSLQCQYFNGLDLTAEQIPLVPYGQGLIGQTVTRPQVFRVNNPAKEPLFVAETDLPPHAPPETAVMTVPILVRGGTWGVLVAYQTADKTFSNFDLDLLASISSSIGSAIEHAWLVQNLRARQQELLDNRNTLQAIIDGILHPIYTINTEWQLVSINHNKVAELATPDTEVVGQACYQAFFQRTVPCEHCQAHHVLQHKEPQTWSVRWKGNDHLPQEWDVNAYPIPGHQAGSASAVIVWQDRTDERRLEQSLLQAGKLAAIGQLAAGVAHEINNPLTAINANAEMLKMFIAPEEDNYQSIDLIHRAGLRAAKVVGGLLDFARQQSYTFVPIDINRSIEQALDLVTYQLNIGNVTVVKDFETDLPRVPASSEHIKSVWINLFVNARDAMRDAGIESPRLEISTRRAPKSEQVQIIIRDNGPGISAAEAAHIFEPFYTTKDPGKGTGLGLATVHRIVAQHGGEIEMICPPGQGATFVVHLPAQLVN